MTLSDFEIEEAVLSACDKKWRKVAMIIGRVLDKHENNTTAEAIGLVVGKLVEAGKLDANGNIKNWRASEIRITT